MSQQKPTVEDFLHAARNQRPVVSYEESVRKLKARSALRRKRFGFAFLFRAEAHPLFSQLTLHFLPKPATAIASVATVLLATTIQFGVPKEMNMPIAQQLAPITTEIPTAAPAVNHRQVQTSGANAETRSGRSLAVALFEHSAHSLFSSSQPIVAADSVENIQQPEVLLPLRALLLTAPQQQPQQQEASHHYVADVQSTKSIQKDEVDQSLVSTESALTRFSVEYRVAVRSATALSSNLVDNMALSVFYTLSEHHAVGVEGGREPFLQSSSLPVTVSMTQQQTSFVSQTTKSDIPTVGAASQTPQSAVKPWVGAAYQYTHDAVSLLGGAFEIKPCARVFMGASDAGVLGRFLMGVQYAPSLRLSILFAGEGSASTHTEQGVTVVTPKIGVTAGVSVKF